ncbi:MAG: protein kinase [Oscillospiraceae bacterium]|nr:protein kinase [Oscillospiraceae bacterium]
MAFVSERALRPGTIVHNRYQVERALGEGGFGVTYLVTDLKENRIAAMKEFMPDELAVRSAGGTLVRPIPGKEMVYKKFLDMFFDEAQAIYKFKDHPNIVDVWHLFHGNNTAYYVMEYIAGDDLKHAAERSGGRLSWTVLKPVVGQLCSALTAVHRTGRTHCDISPDNIFIQTNGQVKLIDFGAVKSKFKNDTSIVLLKPGFAPPEQTISNGNIGPWTDVYALAVTIYWASTGKMPQDSKERLTRDRTIWPSQLGVPIPSMQWEQVLRKGMALRVQDRYQSADVFWSHLSAATGNTGSGGYSPTNGVYTTSEIGYSRFEDRPVPNRNSRQEQARTAGLQLALVGMKGYYKGTRIPINRVFELGRDKASCHFCYPENTPGISFHHARIWVEKGVACIADHGSSCGTFVRGIRLKPGTVYRLTQGDQVCLGSEAQMFYVTQT